MNSATKTRATCPIEEIVAYLDGELETRSLSSFEVHLAGCEHCAAELKLQRRLLSELESALGGDAEVEIPKNFAQIVAVRAKADLSGVRSLGERKRAVALCGVLAILSFALLGATAASESVLGPARLLWRSGATLLNFLGHALYDAGAGVAVLSRGLGGHLLFESRPVGLLVVLLFASALFVLRRLIVGYHRTRTIV